MVKRIAEVDCVVDGKRIIQKITEKNVMKSERLSPSISSSFRPVNVNSVEFSLTITTSLATWKDIAAGLRVTARPLSPGYEMARVIEQMVSEAETHWTEGE